MMMEQNNKNDYQHRIITIPNILSFIRLCMIPLIVWLYCVEQRYLLTGIVLVLSGATDMIDGFVARHFHMISDLGKILDPVADKLTQGTMLLCLVTRFPFMMIPLGLMIVKEFYMGLTGAMVIKKTGKVLGAQWHGKAVTVLLYAMMILHVFWYDIPDMASNLFIGVCVVMMVISLILYGSRNRKALQQNNKSDKNV